MSRIGNWQITIPSGVEVKFDKNLCMVKGPKGEMSYQFDERIKPNQEGDTLSFSRENDDKESRAKHGLTRALVANMVQGVSDGFQKKVEIQRGGFLAEMRRKDLLLTTLKVAGDGEGSHWHASLLTSLADVDADTARWTPAQGLRSRPQPVRSRPSPQLFRLHWRMYSPRWPRTCA